MTLVSNFLFFYFFFLPLLMMIVIFSWDWVLLLFLDWYFWFPLYTCSSIVNFVNGLPGRKSPNIIKPLAKFSLWIGLFLFIKVVFEDLLRNKQVSGFWSVDMRERVVREKIGSGLVIGSMALQLINPKPAQRFESGKLLQKFEKAYYNKSWATVSSLSTQ